MKELDNKSLVSMPDGSFTLPVQLALVLPASLQSGTATLGVDGLRSATIVAHGDVAVKLPASGEVPATVSLRSTSEPPPDLSPADGGDDFGKDGDVGDSVMPTVPDAPTMVIASSGDGKADVSWKAPFDGNSQIKSYTVVSSPGNLMVMSTEVLPIVWQRPDLQQRKYRERQSERGQDVCHGHHRRDQSLLCAVTRRRRSRRDVEGYGPAGQAS